MVARALSQNDLGVILDTVADVIEGGDEYTGGSQGPFVGIPGQYPSNELLRNATAQFNCGDANTTTRVDYDGTTYVPGDFGSTELPPFFLLCVTPKNASSEPNKNAARKIESISSAGAAVWFETAEWPATPFTADTFIIKQGFKRTKNFGDIDSTPEEFDRFFHLSMLPDVRLPYAGDGLEYWRGTLKLRLRILKYGRINDAEASAITNISILRSGITRATGTGLVDDQRDSLYTTAILPPAGAPTIITNDSKKIVIEDSFPIIYSIDRTLP